jgi:AcrR family transcriptional regulator
MKRLAERRGSARGSATRVRILDTARGILTNEGLESFALRDVAKRSGVQLGNLQYYFRSREDLIEAVIAAESHANVDFMDALAANADDLDDYVRRLVQLMVQEYMGLGGKLWPVLRLLRTHSERFRDVSRDVYRRHFRSMVAAMRRFGAPGSERELLAKARLITALIDGAATQAHLWSNAGASAAFRALCAHTGEFAVAIAHRTGASNNPSGRIADE